MSNKVLGIDLGTGNSVVAIFENGSAKIIENNEGNATTPSVINFADNNEILVGITAKRKATVDPHNTIYEIKRLMGHQYTDQEVQTTISQVPYSIIKNQNGDAAVSVHNETYSPPEISAHILRKMKKIAEDHTNESITDAIITVPAYFNNTQRQATIDAGKIAGLNVLRIINEPTAAAIAFCQDKTFSNSTHLLILDSGSGTTDISILDALTVDGELSIEVLATSGDTHLGGTDIDNSLIDWVVSEFNKSDGIDLRTDVLALSRVKEAAERAKIELSTMMQTDINLPYITANASGAKHLNVKLTRSKLESLFEGLLTKTFACIETALNDAKLNKSDIKEVLLVGGTTRIPKLQERLQQYFGQEPNKSVNPDLAVALGAAIQGAVLSGNKTDLLLLDVIPLTLSIETLGSISVPMIDKNTTVPHSRTEAFSTAADNQPAVTIRIAQGEYKQFTKNKLLGQFELTDILPAPKGVPKIEVTFSVDNNSILTVKAKDMASNKENKIVISNTSGLSKEDIEAAMADFEQHKKDDEVFASKISMKNRIESSIHSFGLLQSNDKLTEEQKVTLDAGMKQLHELTTKIDETDVDVLTEEYNKILEPLIQVSTALYQSVGSDVQNEDTSDDDDDDEVELKDTVEEAL